MVRKRDTDPERHANRARYFPQLRCAGEGCFPGKERERANAWHRGVQVVPGR